MDTKKIIFILCLLIVIVSLNVISAESLDNSNNLSQDLIQKSDSSSTIDPAMIKKESVDVYYVDVKSKNSKEDGSEKYPYKTLNNQNLEKISSNSTVIVSEGTYKLSSIEINKNLVISGANKNKVIFTSTTNSSVFRILDGVTVNFSNFTLKGFSSKNSAAITNNGNLTIEDLNLINNVGESTSSKGGSIYNTGELNIIDSSFEDNSASWGAAVYNTKNTNVINSKFRNNHIYNVGGALYNLRGNLTLYSSRFYGNRAVSGAAIYNAMGYLYVNDTEFYKNDAEKFFGGAIYSTGIAITNNCQYYLNHATKDGGAITNTNNFTIINCIFQENNANENGGVIENVPWSANEKGIVTITNSSFKDNSAGNFGGVIISYDKPDAVGDYGTITVRNSIFDSNSATNAGVIYNEQYMDFQNCVFKNNNAEKNNVIYSKDKLIKSINNNWWGTNKPKKSDIGVTPKVYRIMKFTNNTALITNLTSNLQLSLNTLNTGEIIDVDLPERTVYFESENTILPYRYTFIENTVNFSVLSLGDKLSAKIDNQKLSLKPGKLNVTYSLLNKNLKLQINVSIPANIGGKLSVKINSNTIFNKVSFNHGKIVLTYNIPNAWTNGKYRLGISLITKTGESLRDNNVIIVIPKRKIVSSFTIVNKTEIKAGKTIKLVATLRLGGNNITSGNVCFKINGKTISTVKVSKGKAILSYTIPKDFSPKTYKLSMIYSGDGNKYSKTIVKNITLLKQDVHTNMADIITVSRNSSTKIVIKLLDENDNKVNYGKACYKYNNKTIKTNIVIEKGFFTFTFNPNVIRDNHVTLTIKFGENSKYNSFIQDILLIIQ